MKYILLAILFTCSVTAQVTVTNYEAIPANCVNTTTETTVFLDTLVSGQWHDGHMVALNMDVVSKNNSGGNANLTLKLKIDGVSITVLNASVIPNNTGEGHCWRGITMRRKGNDIFVYTSSGAAPIYTIGLQQAFVSTDSFGANTFSGVNFGADKVFEVTATWSVANALTYFNVTSGNVEVH